MMLDLGGPAEPAIQAKTLSDWNDIVGGAFAGCVVDATTPDFAGRLSMCSIDELRFVKINANTSQVRRWFQHPPNSNAHNTLVHLQAKGTGIHRQGGCAAPIEPGHSILCDADRPYQIDFVTPYEMFVLQFPEQLILNDNPAFNIDRSAGQKLDIHRSQLLLAFLAAAWEQIDILGDDPDWRDCVSRVTTDLTLRAINVETDGRAAGASHETRRAVFAYVRDNLDDPALRTGGIAKHLGLSPRSVQNVFETLSTTASAYILKARLTRAAERLRRDRSGAVSITQIAYDCGFSDSAYFSRCFNKAFGVAPRRFRSATRESLS